MLSVSLSLSAGVVGATIRMYLEKYEPATGDLKKMPLDVIKELADVSVCYPFVCLPLWR